jgi:acyl-CoA thioester hydrolase
MSERRNVHPSSAAEVGGAGGEPQRGAREGGGMGSSPEPAGYSSLSGELRNGIHYLPVRVYYEDTDFSGVVYHASYLRFLERGRTDFLRAGGVDQSTLHAGGEGLIFAVRRMTIDYLLPARMDDVLIVETRTAEVRGASLSIDQRIARGRETIVTADVRVAAILGGRPTRIPDALRAVLSGAAGGSLSPP